MCGSPSWPRLVIELRGVGANSDQPFASTSTLALLLPLVMSKVKGKVGNLLIDCGNI